MTQELTVDKKQATAAKKKAGAALELAQSLVIESDADMENAGNVHKQIKEYGKAIKAKKEEITKPLNEALKNAREMFKPAEQEYKEAEDEVERKMIDYNKKVEAERKKKQEQMAKRVNKGTMKYETAVKKQEELPEEKKKGEAYTTKKVPKLSYKELKNATPETLQWLAQNGYLAWETGKVRKDALAGTEIPGVEVYYEDVIATK